VDPQISVVAILRRHADCGLAPGAVRQVPISTLRALMGHSEVGTTTRYVDIAEGDKRDVIACAF
jgi:hypothetical protein